MSVPKPVPRPTNLTSGVSFDPISGIGSTAVGFLDPAENMEESIGQTVGGFAGSLIPVPVVGNAIGAFIGGKIGGLFADDGNYPYARVKVDYKDGRAYTRDSAITVLDGAGKSQAKSLGDTLAGVINDVVSLIGGEVKFNNPNPKTPENVTTLKLGFASGRNDRIGSGFFAGGQGDFASGATYTNLKSADQAINYSLTEFLQRAKFENEAAQDIISSGLAANKTAQDILPDLINLRVQEQQAPSASYTTDTDDNASGLTTTQASDDAFIRLANNQDKSLPLLLLGALSFIIFK